MRVARHSQRIAMKQESGLYIVLVAVMLFMLIGLVVLVIGLGAIGTNKTRLQNAANAAALAALEGYLNADPSYTSYDAKAGAAVARANKLMTVNRMTGTSRDLGELVHGNPTSGSVNGPAGHINFGMWFAKPVDPLNPNNHCGGVYPCFEDYNGTLIRDVNAARVSVNNQSDNPLVIGLAGLLGQQNFFLSSVATAALSPRCVAYLMDVSGSSQYETAPGADGVFNMCNPTLPSGQFPGAGCGHPSCNASCMPLDCDHCYPSPPNPPGDPIIYYPDTLPANVGYGFLRGDNVAGLNCASISSFTSPEARFWCNYERDLRGGAPTTAGFRHNRNDYRLMGTKMGNPSGPLMSVQVDTLYVDGLYNGPQPLTRNFLAFNAGLRLVNSASSPGDLSVVMAFTRDIRDRYPDPVEDGKELTKDLGFLIQLTNVNNRGLRDWQGVVVPGMGEVHPNFIDRGWFPLPSIPGGDETNLVLALNTAAEALHSTCLPTSRKAIVMATDGVSTCSVTNTDPLQPDCANSYAKYLQAEGQLLTDDLYSGSPRKPSILERLTDWEISLTALVDSEGVGPNFYNIRSNASGCIYPPNSSDEPTDPKCFLSYEEARAHGFGGLGNPYSFYDYSSSVPPALGANTEDNAYQNFGKQYVRFGRPVGALGRLSIQTGGFMCGLLPLHPAGAGVYIEYPPGNRNGVACDQTCTPTPQYPCLPCILPGNLRSHSCDPENGLPCDHSNAQVYSPVLLSKSEQAAQCVQNTVGLNPFTLVASDSD